MALDAAGAKSIVKSLDHESITAICEVKEWGQKLDTGKAKREENPHHQLQDYLSTLRIRFGFLTNGRLWRLYDTDRITAQKTYLEFDLQCIMALKDEAEKHVALSLFAFFFGRDTYVRPVEGQGSLIEQTIVESSDFTLDVEENLKAVIYGVDGEDSLFELMGKAIYKANAKRNPGLDTVYENSVILLFRLLFVVYFEDKNSALLESHPFYKQHSLGYIYQRLRDKGEKHDALHDGFFALKNLFEILDEGAEDIDIPLFNGGLFDPERAPLLLTPKIFTNAQLRTILEKLLFKTNRGTTLFDTRRDFKNMSVSHLGRIYEGLLEFRFERAEEDAVYLEYTSTGNSKPVEAYFDTYDAALIKNQNGFSALREVKIKKGSIYLKSASNSRKSTASYYTPPSLSARLVKAGIASALEQAQKLGRELAEIKILDNACGSGHFLVESLNHLTDVALERLEDDTALQAIVESEREKIVEQLQFLNLAYEPDDAQILKRALLKRCIYGVDLNPFAVELARLSLWMDSFIFGTPLSFIEHHVQHGNALMGASIADFIAYNKHENKQHDMFVDNLLGRFDALVTVMKELDALRDTTTEEIEQSKKLWKTQIAPRLTLLSRALSFISTRAALMAEGRADDVKQLDKTPNLLDLLFDETRNAKSGKNEVLRLITEYAERYRFFHYEIAFPEAFAGTRKGFDVVIGNPPWDKTKFSDLDFFPQYHSNYRSLKNSEKKAVQDRLLVSEHITTAYEAAKRDMEAKNDYYRERYPLNKGAGDGNLFRFFVERNLNLIAPSGSLNYVLPSALMFEDGSSALRRYIFDHFQVRFFHSFENRNLIFEDVDSRYKFALMQIVCEPLADAAATIDTAFYILDPAELDDEQKRTPYALETLKRLSPDQWSMMELRDRQDLQILDKCYAAYDPLDRKWLNFRNELHMTGDKHLFIEEPAAGLFPLYEGKMIWQYSHHLAEPQYWLEPSALKKALASKEIARMADDLGVPRKAAEVHEDAIRYESEFMRLGFRCVASDTNERTLVFALLPPGVGAGHSMSVSVPKRYVLQAGNNVGIEPVSPLRLLFALAMFNSLPIDWMARFMIQINVSLSYLYQLPVPQPTNDEILESPDYSQLAKNAALLTLAASWDDFSELASLFSIQKADVPATAKACDKLRAENDKIVARLYGITDQEFAHLITSFKVMAGKRPEYVSLFAPAEN
ncbi:MAG: class I SAM-dependent DNA methyltransferase [Rhodocyclaceae bacterium]|nr:class I SAM-dependent DNA methyltransferase [Rhodocyclaceae bacterium]